MYRRVAVTVVLMLVLVVASARADSPTLPPATWLLDHVRALAADDMEGRQAGTTGADRAADVIARSFREAGLRPGGDRGTFLQTFTVPTGIKLAMPTSLALVGETTRPLTPGASGRVVSPTRASEVGVASLMPVGTVNAWRKVPPSPPGLSPASRKRRAMKSAARSAPAVPA